jgi:hypothetical protein
MKIFFVQNVLVLMSRYNSQIADAEIEGNYRYGKREVM